MNPAKFMREVRSEMTKVTWPTRKETTVSAVMVVIVATLAAIIFLLADWVISSIVTALLGLS